MSSVEIDEIVTLPEIGRRTGLDQSYLRTIHYRDKRLRPISPRFSHAPALFRWSDVVADLVQLYAETGTAKVGEALERIGA